MTVSQNFLFFDVLLVAAFTIDLFATASTMLSMRAGFICAALSLAHNGLAGPYQDLTIYVDPFIGTEGPVANSGANSGDTFPGVGLPFGVVRLGPDTNELDQTTNPFAGYTPDGNGQNSSVLCSFYTFVVRSSDPNN